MVMDNLVLDKERLLNKAERHCQRRGARLTPSRRQVLSLVMEYSDVVKAYDILSDLQKLKGNAAPPTVYRALDFLVEMGILHRAELLNGFIFCRQFHQHHRSIILSCTHCGKVVENAAAEQVQALMEYAKGQGFALDEIPLVFNGVCIQCEKRNDI